MAIKKRFPDSIMSKIHEERILGICTGSNSTNRFIGIWVVYLVLLIFIPTASVLADMGPKPHMEFDIKYEGEELQIVSSLLYECSLSDCSDAQPLEDIAVQGIRCYANNLCTAVAYGFRDYHILELTFSDGRTLRSNVFKTVGFLSNYTVTVRENDLLVKERFDLADSIRNIFNSVCCFFAGFALLPLGMAFPSRRKK
jgi:hypothetical protein